MKTRLKKLQKWVSELDTWLKLAVSIGVALGAIWAAVIKFFPPMKPWPDTPKVLYLYPVESEKNGGGFGVLRRDGFLAGASGYSGQHQMNVQPLAATQDSLKAGKLGSLEEKIHTEFKDSNVVAVVAPSITEATLPVIRLVRDLSPGLPIILESSIAMAAIDTSRVFRLSSGVDTRGRDIARLILDLQKRGRKVGIIAEEDDKSYGGQMLQWAVTESTALLNVRSLRYAPTRFGQRLASFVPTRGGLAASKDDVVKLIADPNAVIFFLGLSSDYAALLDAAYRQNSRYDGRAKLVGIMNAFRLDDLYARAGKANRLRSELIYELTDLNFKAPLAQDPGYKPFFDAFARDSVLRPGLRDQAYSFDEGRMLADALRGVRDAKSYEDGLSRLSAALRAYSGPGLTGTVMLAGAPASSSGGSASGAAQNTNTTLHIARYDPATRKWLLVLPSEL